MHIIQLVWGAIGQEQFHNMNNNSKASELSFSEALIAMKDGRKIARTGWNGKGMYAVIMPGYPDGIVVNEATRKQHRLEEGTKLVFRPYMQLFTAQKDVAMWVPSCSDILANDWNIVA